MDESALPGGLINAVVRIGATVRRPPSTRSDFVHELLALLENHGWSGAPRFLGRDEQGREILSHIDGEAAWSPDRRRAAGSDASLVRVAGLVREFHDLTSGSPLSGADEVICHNDLAPKNTVYAVDGEDWRPLAFIDWDLAAPGARVHDVAHLCWQYLDLGPGIVDVPDAARRIGLVCDAYGHIDPDQVVDAVLWWQDRCGRGIEAGASQGDPAMVRLRDRGVVEEVRAAYAWVSAHRSALGRGN
ncbi:phosphotransferase family protein [Streptomyces sp. N35]|uniref:phosphotransferase family protein n=1 Tax=Streptomyces sp. N35 TaxID=2795730 RepID=UPI0018F5FC35|nr:phosphotransferase [Streptomyces sp. N35]